MFELLKSNKNVENVYVSCNKPITLVGTAEEIDTLVDERKDCVYILDEPVCEALRNEDKRFAEYYTKLRKMLLGTLHCEFSNAFFVFMTRPVLLRAPITTEISFCKFKREQNGSKVCRTLESL